jgi:hypothetical protein
MKLQPRFRALNPDEKRFNKPSRRPEGSRIALLDGFDTAGEILASPALSRGPELLNPPDDNRPVGEHIDLPPPPDRPTRPRVLSWSWGA